MKRTLLYIGIVLSVAVGSVAVYQPAVLAQVAGFFSSISVSSGGTLNGTFAGTATFTNALVASITGNAATATALAAVPTQCSGSTPIATGIAANGNANCTGTPGLVVSGTSSSGYAVLPSGLVYQWGQSPSFDTGPSTITLPHACPTAILSVQISDSIASSSRRIWASGNYVSGSSPTIDLKNDGLGQGWYQVICY